jgi:hypothetical protein
MNDIYRRSKKKPYTTTRRSGTARNPARELTFKQLASAKTTLSAQDQEELAWYFAHYGDRILRMLPNEISCPENLSLIGSLLCQHAPGKITYLFLKAHIETATDVLRLAVAISGGDLSLTTPCNFKGITRGLRQLLLGFIEEIPDPSEEIENHCEHWNRLAKALRTHHFANRFPRTCATLQSVLKPGHALQTKSAMARLTASRFNSVGTCFAHHFVL